MLLCQRANNAAPAISQPMIHTRSISRLGELAKLRNRLSRMEEGISISRKGVMSLAVSPSPFFFQWPAHRPHGALNAQPSAGPASPPLVFIYPAPGAGNT